MNRTRSMATAVAISALALSGTVVGGVGFAAHADVPASESSASASPDVVTVDLPGLTGFVDERTGDFDAEVPGIMVPGVAGERVAVGITFRGELGKEYIDRNGFGPGWALSGPFADASSGVLRVFLEHGGSYEADSSLPSGLIGYEGARVFEQIHPPIVLPSRDGVRGSTVPSYSLRDESKGTTYYFDAIGNPIILTDDAGARVDWLWAEGGSGTLESVVDSEGGRTSVTKTDNGFELVAGDGRTLALEFGGWNLGSAVTPLGNTLSFEYWNGRLWDIADQHTGYDTNVTYQWFGIRPVVPSQIIVLDGETGKQEWVRTWTYTDTYPGPGPLIREIIWD